MRELPKSRLTPIYERNSQEIQVAPHFGYSLTRTKLRLLHAAMVTKSFARLIIFLSKTSGPPRLS